MASQLAIDPALLEPVQATGEQSRATHVLKPHQIESQFLQRIFRVEDV
ncbi:hypothetical protein [Melaminivora suipulveris]|nr:hypothetical protein [Melaminivora suipulveris]